MYNLLLALFLSLWAYGQGTAAVLTVGPPGSGKTYTSVCEAWANATATTGSSPDTLEIDGDAPGGGQAVYYFNPNLGGNEVCNIGKSIKLLGVGTLRPLLTRQNSAPVSASHGFLRPTAGYFTAENIEFSNAKCADNCQPIWGEAVLPQVTIKNCYFHDNDNGLLTGNDTRSSELRTNNILIENSEFSHNGRGDGNTHNVYIGESYSLTFRYNFSHDSYGGQLLKSRAGINYVTYNNFVDSIGSNYPTTQGWSNQELDFSNGGRVYVIGNVIRQGENYYPANASPPNSNLLTFYAEGPTYTATPNIYQQLYVINNTFVNARTDNQAQFVRPFYQTPTELVIKNNIFAGPGTVYMQHNTAQSNPTGNSIYSTVAGASFVNAGGLDFRLQSGSSAVDATTLQGTLPSGGGADTMSTNVDKQYAHPRTFITRSVVGSAFDNGAYERTLAGTAYIGSVYTEALNGAGQVALFWGQALHEASPPTGYLIKRNGSTLTTAASGATTYTDTTVATDGTAYTYTVTPQGSPNGAESNAGIAGAARACAATIGSGTGWFCLSGTNAKFADVCNAAGHANCTTYWYYFAGGARDPSSKCIYQWGGDGSSHHSAEVYRFCEDTLQWSIKRDSASTTGAETASDDSNAPGSRRTYLGLTWLNSVSELFSYGGFLGDGSTYSSKIWRFKPADNTWSNSNHGIGGQALGSAAYNSANGLAYIQTNDNLYSYDPATTTVTQRASAAVGNFGAVLVADPAHNRLYQFGSGVAWWFDVANSYARTDLPASCAVMKLGSYPPIAFDSVHNRIVHWDGNVTITLLDTTTNTCSAQTIVGQPPSDNGPNPWLFYSPELDGFWVLPQNHGATFLRLTESVPSIDNTRCGGGSFSGGGSFQ